MAHTLTFNGDQVGQHLMSMQPVNEPLTPANFRAGLFQQNAGVNADSRNLLRSYRFVVTLVGADPVTASRLLENIQQLQGQQGDIVAIFDSQQLELDQWIINRVESQEPQRGFGGRWLPDVIIYAVGETPPRYSEV